MTTQPILPCGYNSWEINGDEMDGRGVNEALWPVLFDSYEGLTPIILTDEFTAAFGECPDIVFGCPDNEIVVPYAANVLVASGMWSSISFEAASNSIVFPHEDNVYVINKTWPDIDASPVGSSTVTVPDDTVTQEMKELT
jgi:hypothetical protein